MLARGDLMLSIREDWYLGPRGAVQAAVKHTNFYSCVMFYPGCIILITCYLKLLHNYLPELPS